MVGYQVAQVRVLVTHPLLDLVKTGNDGRAESFLIGSPAVGSMKLLRIDSISRVRTGRKNSNEESTFVMVDDLLADFSYNSLLRPTDESGRSGDYSPAGLAGVATATTNASDG